MTTLFISLFVIIMLLFWLGLSYLVYYGFYLLRWIGIIPVSLTLELEMAKDMGEVLGISMILAGLIMISLHKLHIINLSKLFLDLP